MKAILALEDGTIFEGKSFGAEGESLGEVVFNTSMTGYQEILTDPSYKNQIVAMTYPLIGNYGVNDEDFESQKPHLSGFVVLESSRIASNWRAQMTLDQFLKKYNVVGIEGIDTRALTLHIRNTGAMKGIISTSDFNVKNLIKKANDYEGLVGIDLVKEVTCKKTYEWNTEGKYKVVLIDCGAKHNIMRELAKRGCKVTVVPAKTTSDDILAMEPDGIMLSNGPGDPAAVTYVIETVRHLIGKTPIFGICLGHQMLGQALGGKTYKLKFGHRGANHPVKNLQTEKVEITCQNHGFCVDIDSLNQEEVELTHVNLNDHTSEGLRHKKYPVFSVQHHPESSAGPHDSRYLFDQFIELMEQHA
ncbi:carbamoyl phosphate synthase small subunit [candidate division WOR-1 bacterium RIFOXYC2_FULL_37_10]|uniref:Carbamoyl phosphate synthase small chain n=1 Tax=candidate division WOR-1 bacterium RIFOXYB2_FULL_37_13 TaxID=1802579 RepID=A0A1F4SM30_UNCSA|nr:MAG: carbamoyl phosphate synthase small subunit [candidate division WOR-1 bacterium RIFOXYA2_FULL_37_7]OGC21460.1 MAG: carbamoyl phosphate synthase small subunit [candidate division WOR-1 bacterium RIFOXYB2_FULL_37_13]OGC36547.1 MAG: carbamoyl phosphate synthase small subunit [candidate division WOR-1 bacterium RIFOXYC2_FULL_37_10]